MAPSSYLSRNSGIKNRRAFRRQGDRSGLPCARALALPLRVGPSKLPGIGCVLPVILMLMAASSGCGGNLATPDGLSTLQMGTTSNGYLEDGSSGEVWTFEGRAGEIVIVEARSLAFDTVVKLALRGDEFARDDDAGPGTNSRLVTTLPSSANYTITVMAFAGGIGNYTVTVLSLSKDDVRSLEIDKSSSGSLRGEPSDGLWTFRGTRGQSVAIEATSDAFDTSIQLISPTGDEVARDDDGGLGTNSRLLTTLQEDGIYRIMVAAFGDGTGDYEVTVRDIEVTSSLEINRLAEGTLASSNAGHWTFDGIGGQTLIVEARSDDFDTVIQLTSPTGDEIAWNDDGDQGSTDSRLVATLPESGKYRVTVTAFDDRQGDYEVAVRSVNIAALTIDVPANGTLGEPSAGHWRFEGVGGQTVSVEASSDDFDTVIQLTSPTGDEIAWDDDGGRDPTDSRLVATLPASGEYRIAVTAFRDRTGDYQVAVRSLDTAVLSIDTPATGTLEGEPSDGHWRFEGVEGQRIRVDASSDDFDTIVQLTSPTGEEIARDDDGGPGTNSRLVEVLPHDGMYRITVTAFGRETGTYKVLVTE